MHMEREMMGGSSIAPLEPQEEGGAPRGWWEKVDVDSVSVDGSMSVGPSLSLGELGKGRNP